MHTFFFWGGRRFPAGGIFLGDNFPSGRKFPGGEYFKRNFTLGVFVRIFIRNSSYVLLSVFRLNFTRGDVKCNCQR